jgi:hypothetical protein
MKSFSVTPCPVDLSDALLRQGVTEIDKYEKTILTEYPLLRYNMGYSIIKVLNAN